MSEEEIQPLLDKWTISKNLSKDEFLIRDGQTENHLFYVVKGTLRIFYPYKEDEICVGFGYDNTLICSYPSFVRNLPSKYYIQALSDTELLAIRKEDFYQLFDAVPKIERCWRIMLEEALADVLERDTEMKTSAPKERYEHMLQRSPHVFQYIPKKHIASYLNMRPETMSRLK